MIYTLRSSRRLIAVLKSWNGVVTQSHSLTGHWTWCVNRSVASVLAWAVEHHFKWEVNPDGLVWDAAVAEINKPPEADPLEHMRQPRENPHD